MLFFNPTVKKGETKKITSLYRGPYTIVEIINDLIFKVEDKKTKNVIQVHYDELKKDKTQEKPFKTDPEAKRKTAVKQKENIGLKSLDDDDIIEIESSTDSESNPKIQSKKPLKGQTKVHENCFFSRFKTMTL